MSHDPNTSSHVQPPTPDGIREPPRTIPAGDDEEIPRRAAGAGGEGKPPHQGGKPPFFNELTPRAIVCGLIVAALMGASYPYVVLKLGFGPNVSVVAAILGYVALGLIVAPLAQLVFGRGTPYNRWENNIVETAGTAAAQTAFMCVLLAAFDMLAQSKVVSFSIQLTELQAFAWLTSAGLLGVLLAVPLRQHYIVDEKLPFPDGMAAGETLIVCDGKGPAAVRAALAMLTGLFASALLMTLTEDSHVFKVISSTFVFPVGYLAVTGFGVEWSLLAIGSGMLVGMRINTSMLLGSILSWVIAPYLLSRYGIVSPDFKKNDILFWVMWPATGMMVSAGLAALFLRWRVLARTFKNLSAGRSADDFPLSWAVVGAVVCAAALVVVQKTMLGQPVWITLVAIVLSAPLALVGLRVLGETNWGPISALSNLMQGVFGLLAPGNIAANMVASGTTGTIATQSEGIMQDYRAGYMVGTSPRKLTYMQLLAIPVGAATVAWMYPILRTQYGIGGERGLSSPISRKWAGFAEILSKGLDALPKYALEALVIAVILGILLAVLEATLKNKSLIPSPTGLGIGMLVPASVIVTMVIGGLIGAVWGKVSPRTSESYMIPLASGLIAGEALVAVVVPVLVICGVL
jgi:uncharacterized oligopeptide transporter (OPT) family protein